MTTQAFRLIQRERPIAEFPQSDPVAEFTRLADQIQARDGCHRVTALQKAIDEHPDRYAEYCRAFADHGSLSDER